MAHPEAQHPLLASLYHPHVFQPLQNPVHARWTADKYQVDSSESLKELGNEQYKNGKYEEAIKTYTLVITRVGEQDEPPTTTLRVAFANRAQCYINLAAFRQRITTAPKTTAYTSSSTIALEQQKIVEKMGGTKVYYYSATLDKPHREATAKATTRPVKFKVIVLPGDRPTNPRTDSFVYTEQVPTYLCDKGANTAEVIDFMRSLVPKHHPEIWNSSPRWNCYLCGKRATLMLHTPGSHLDEAIPFIANLATPICESNGRCEQEMGQKMADIAPLRKITF
ncbi:hypothetical protein CC1G_11092 [Coprinopsis cinerea okayama7|uniref:Uncharacterized protein n=1 Tax=Coprinopsis cinerea (strain Okayama-7 / 130 / ATCC MYA-4618 / FGSC 9003) TaxID=240176 RepID=A8P7M5_COPC7|nr:hypothetical protein CC1G_11092 [Coprinopsis cinerea okayama7\|eukprot:XP_001839392.2 hypothetical protein CC1G_11092 [Coprinopsis cinerea okayama7\